MSQLGKRWAMDSTIQRLKELGWACEFATHEFVMLVRFLKRERTQRGLKRVSGLIRKRGRKYA